MIDCKAPIADILLHLLNLLSGDKPMEQHTEKESERERQREHLINLLGRGKAMNQQPLMISEYSAYGMASSVVQ
eukprot:COSAG03_NODE_3072_length_2248_cov_3.879479_2_plen_74_part_00